MRGAQHNKDICGIQHYNLNLCTKSFRTNVVFRLLGQLVFGRYYSALSESLLSLC